MAPVVSVVLPVFNQAQYLPAAIESILGQGFGDLELIVIDDGSTDGSAEIARSIGDPRLKLEALPVRQGQAAARNRGVGMAAGAYLAFLDSDDVALRVGLQIELDHLERHPGIDLVAGGITLMDAEGQPGPSVVQPMDDTELRWSMLFNNPIATSTVLVRAALARRHRAGFEDRFAGADDYGFWSAMLRLGRAEIIEPVLSHYRQHPTQLSQREGTALPAIQVAKSNLAELGIVLDDAGVGTLRIVHDKLAELDLAGDSAEATATNLAWFSNYYKVFQVFRGRVDGDPATIGRIEARLKDHAFNALTRMA
jgi:glycosyltransferase involved in cell wall biosynthesis